MSFPIKAKWTLDWDVWRDANRAHVRATIPLWIKIGLAIWLCWMLVAALLKGDWLGVFLSGGFVVVWFGLIRFVMMPLRWKRTFNGLASKNESLAWGFYEDRFTSESGGSKSSVEWRLIIKSVVFGRGVLLYPQANFSYWIPVTAFASAEEFSRFVELVKSKVPKTKEIR